MTMGLQLTSILEALDVLHIKVSNLEFQSKVSLSYRGFMVTANRKLFCPLFDAMVVPVGVPFVEGFERKSMSLHSCFFNRTFNDWPVGGGVKDNAPNILRWPPRTKQWIEKKNFGFGRAIRNGQ